MNDLGSNSRAAKTMTLYALTLYAFIVIVVTGKGWYDGLFWSILPVELFVSWIFVGVATGAIRWKHRRPPMLAIAIRSFR